MTDAEFAVLVCGCLLGFVAGIIVTLGVAL